jgi:adenylate cyclase
LGETGTRQRLAAILAADAAGYSRLMSADDHGTVAALDAARAVFRKQILANQGRVVDMAGDSILSVFDTAAGAVSAALAIQQELNTHSAELPEDQRLHFRIGVHLGDVIEKADGTIYGDGVNIAARLQALAEPGGIIISEAVLGSVKKRVAAVFTDLGEQKVKNIAEAVSAYRVTPLNQSRPSRPPRRSSPAFTRWIAGGVAALAALVAGIGWYATQSGPLSTAKAPATESKSIAVLPFTNMSDDKDTAYFADGVHEDLLTQLALLGELKVVSRMSVMDYRNTKKNIRQIGTELGVGALVEGSVRRAGNQVRVTAQLIDAKSDKHLWAKSYDRELKDIFAIQSELATEIARSLKISLEPQEQTRLAKRPTENLEAYDLFLRQQELVNQTAGSIRILSSVPERIALLSKVVALDPSFALAWARLASEHAHTYSFGIDRTPARLAKAQEAFERAQALAREDPLIKIEAGEYYYYALRDLTRAAQAFGEVLAAAPHNVEALIGLAGVRLRQTQWGERIALLERALAVDPRNPRTLTGLANQYRDFRQFDRALALLQQLSNVRPADTDLKAKFYLTEYWRSGSWDAYDKWRQTLPKGAESASARVRDVDADRAVARRDFDEVLRLLELRPDDVKGFSDSRMRAISEAYKTLALRARGDAARATKSARAALRLVETELQGMPGEVFLSTEKARLHAVLGEREAAFATLARLAAAEKSQGDMRWAEISQRQSLQLHALLGDRQQALAELSRQLKLPESQPNELRVDLALASLWDDPQFQAILNDPANNAPISFDSRPALTPEK